MSLAERQRFNAPYAAVIAPDLVPLSIDTAAVLAIDRSLERTNRPASVNGTIVSAAIVVLSGPTPDRGQTLCRIVVTVAGETFSEANVVYELGKGYLYGVFNPGGFGALPLKRGYRIWLLTRNVVAALNLRLILTLDVSYITQEPRWTQTIDLETRGYTREIAIPNPAAGAEMPTQAVPANARWKLRAYKLFLQTSTTVIDRGVRLSVIGPSTSINALTTDVFAQPASRTIDYSWYAGAPHEQGVVGIGQTVEAPLPVSEVVLAFGWSIVTRTLSLQAGDTYGGGFLVVEEWVV